jgi:hypothetical protein
VDEKRPDIDFHHILFEVMTDLDYECAGWLLLVKHIEASSIFVQVAKQHHVKHLEDMSNVI